MDFMQDFINNSSYTWVPIVIFVVITLIAGLIGFWNGWKTSLYFFGWNLVGVISGVLVTTPIMNAFNDIGILKVISASAEATWGLIILFVYMLCINFLAFLFYWIFRSKLKKSMKDNKNAKKSNLFSRFVGMGIAVVSASPATFYLADASAIMSKENGFTTFTDAMARAYTGGKFDGTSNDREEIDVLAHSNDAIKDIADLFNGGNKNPTLTAKAKKDIEKVLNTNITKNIDSIYEGLKSSGIGGVDKNQKLDGVTVKNIDDINPLGIHVSANRQADLKNSLQRLFEKEGNTEAATIAKKLVAKIVG